MSFVSAPFALGMAALWLVYFICPGRARWAVLLLASYGFYLWADAGMLAFLLLTTASTFTMAQWIQRAARKAWPLAACLLLNLGILAGFKLGHLFRGGPVGALLPLGISFYTFQSLGYVLDVYRGKIQADTSLFRYALFVSFFPQLVQGPISRHAELAGQLQAGRGFDYTGFTFGLQRMLWGYCKKLVLSNRLAIAVGAVLGGHDRSGGALHLLAMALYSLQLYMDFSGGIDIAIGAAQTLGIRLTENFARPYFARSISDFWRRWHITLGRWMREYVFYPLSLSRAFARMGRWLRRHAGAHWGKAAPVCAASLAVFLLVGLWHGLSWNYALFGLYQGLLVSLSILAAPWTGRVAAALRIRPQARAWRLFQMARTFALVTFGRILLVTPDLPAAAHVAGACLRALLRPAASLAALWREGASLGLNAGDLLVALLGLCAVLCVSLWQERGFSVREVLAGQRLPVRWAVYLGAAFAVILFGVYGAGYDAAGFIYEGF